MIQRYEETSELDITMKRQVETRTQDIGVVINGEQEVR